MVRISIIIKYINIDFPVDVCGFIFSDQFCAISSLFITHLLFYAGHVCAEYSQGRRRIQRNGNAKCTNCPPFYPSNESFKCKFTFVNANSITQRYMFNQF